MKSVTFKIDGMRCESCAATIAKLVGAEDGVRGVDVSFENGQARILYDPEETHEDRLADLVERPGFHVTARRS